MGPVGVAPPHGAVGPGGVVPPHGAVGLVGVVPLTGTGLEGPSRSLVCVCMNLRGHVCTCIHASSLLFPLGTVPLPFHVVLRGSINLVVRRCLATRLGSVLA